MSDIKKHLNIAEGFQYSVNIEYDLGNEEKIKGFIPTTATFDIIEDIMLSTHVSSTDRARILIGAYGKGKSHFVLVVLSLLMSKNIAAFEGLLSKIKEYNPKLHQFITDYLNSDKKLLPIIIQGGNSSLSQSFLSAMQRTLEMADLADLMPDTHFTAAIEMIKNWEDNYPATFEKLKNEINEPITEFIDKLTKYDTKAYKLFEKLYPGLTSGGAFNPFVGLNVVDLYEDVTKKLKSKGYSGIYVIYDEFSKFLEADITKINSVDIRLLQDFAEKCNRSAETQMHIMLISHKDISNYIDKLPKQKVDGWRGVSERFKHVELKNNFSQIYEIIATVIGQDEKFFKKYFADKKQIFDDCLNTYKNQTLFSELDEGRLETVVYKCYPMQPASTFILPRLSEKVAQNERTLFTFLSSQNKNTLYDFINATKEEFPVLTPDHIYDYFEQVFKKEVYTSPIYAIWKMTNNILSKLETEKYEELGAKIIKTIALIYITDQFEKLAPTPEAITDIFASSGYDTAHVTRVLSELKEKQYVIYQFKSNNYLRLTDKFSSKIEQEIEAYIEKFRTTITAKKVLNDFNTCDYLYPTAYNDDNEIVRYFNFNFITDEEFFEVDNWEVKISGEDGVGVVYGIILTSEENRTAVVKRLAEINHKRVVFVVPNIAVDLTEDCLEYNAVSMLKTENKDDEVLLEELELRIEDNENILSNFVSMYLMPENRGAEWFYQGNRQKVFRKTQISELLSGICSELYTQTPVIKNEMINKDTVTRTIINAMNKVVDALLTTELKPNLGLSGAGPEISIMRSVLINTGILKDIDTMPKLVITGGNEDLYQNVLTVIGEFFRNANNSSFAELYDELVNPEKHIGLKKGVIPMFIAAALNPIKQYIVICKNGAEMELSATLLTAINEKPEDYVAFIENWDKKKEEYIVRLENIFEDHIIAGEKEANNFTYVARAMQRWLASLPKYAKEITGIYKGRRLDREKIKFINALKRPEINAREFLFDDIANIYGLKEFTPSVADNIEKTKEVFDTAIDKLMAGLAEDVRECFGKGQPSKATIVSIMLDWYETLKDSTKSYLYNNGEDKLLGLIANATNDEKAFITRLAKGIVGLRLEDWNDKSIEQFNEGLKSFKDAVESQDQKEETNATNSYTLTFQDDEGNAVSKSFEKCEYSSRAKLLLNEITDAVDSMGQSISENEKRQVLMEVLEKLCK